MYFFIIILLLYRLKFITGVSNLFKRIICTILLVLVSFGFSVNVSAAKRYQWITSTASVTISYDTRSVKYYSEHGKVVDAWILWKFTKAGARKYIKNRRTNELSQEAKWDNFSFFLAHTLISKNSQKLLKIIYYDVNGNVIDSSTFGQFDRWDDFSPGSLGEDIRDKFIVFLNS